MKQPFGWGIKSKNKWGFAIVLLAVAAQPLVAEKTSRELNRSTHYPRSRDVPKSVAMMAKADRLPSELSRGVAPKIIGGKDAEIDAWPAMIALLQADIADNYEAQLCGATLIHPYWVVTAGHCVIGMDPDEIDVLVGGYDLEKPAGSRRINVAEIILHPDYNDNTLNSDIALLRLAEAVENAPIIEIVDTANLSAPGILAKAIGWGDLTGNGDYPAILQEVDVPIVDENGFAQLLGFEPGLTSTMLVAGFGQSEEDTASGDSGGPLLIQDGATDKWMLAGITSYGFPEADVTYGVYTDAGYFREEILGYIYPDYIAWEQETGARGMGRDPDLDGWNNFQEYAFASDPYVGGEPSPLMIFPVIGQTSDLSLKFELKGRIHASDTEFTLLRSISINGPWENLINHQMIVSSAPDATVGNIVTTTELEILYNQVDPSNFFQAIATPTINLLAIPRTLTAFKNATGALTLEDPLHPTLNDRQAKTYRIAGLVAGDQIQITGRSNQFDMRLELVDSSDQSVIAVAEDDAAAGTAETDEHLAFTAVPGKAYLLRVTSETSQALGSYRIDSFNTKIVNELPRISLPGTLNGTLNTTDSLDPLWLPTMYYSDDYLLDISGRQLVKVELQSSAFDALLEIIDAETGYALYTIDDTGQSTDAEIEFETRLGHTYLVRATTSFELETGNYTLKVSAGTPPPELSVPGSVSGTLSETDKEDPLYEGTYIDDYKLVGTKIGQSVTVTLASTQFDCYMYLMDADNDEILDENDDYATTTSNSRITFQPESGRSYRIRVSSYDAGETGSYTLSAN